MSGPGEAQNGAPNIYASVDELQRRLGETLEDSERDRAEALLEDASNLIRAVARIRTPAEDWQQVPVAIVTICLNMAGRAYQNPKGVRQQTLGDLSMTFGNVETGVVVTDEEKRLIRICAGWGAELSSIQLESGYDVAGETVYVPTDTPDGDWLAWQAEG